MKKNIHIFLQSVCLIANIALIFPQKSSATINTPQIIKSAVSKDCISWRVSGMCYWLKCTPFGCVTLTSMKVTHFLPQAVVSTYVGPGGNPWQEMAFVSQTAGGLESSIVGSLTGVTAGGGNAAEAKVQGKRRSSLKFKYADAIGHPSTSIIGGSVAGYSCSSSAKPLVPYFLSTLDSFAWRTGLPESLYPEALMPGLRELGTQISANMWGNIYPRSGFVTQTDDDKASAVIAQRVADIITRTGQPHVYQSIKDLPRPGYWPPDSVTENTGKQNHKWQRLSPKLSNSCAAFPDGNHPAAVNGNQAYALWQPYSCCERMGQTLLRSVDYKAPQ
ncbi:TIGR03756 family integrating conjugative element protein [Rouxiella silvae]|uniref:TIGR03756 family integrating conjugative element protein n=1 Tax=Rouxiella silvae TaxID=1646373 RepID=UPI000A101C0A|nr:TIGR03756 family integrating conjugative element protein [Rouxiella silvae]